jgi:8-oxo-dGTP pyrophosphatase MutT (NUDIX family)
MENNKNNNGSVLLFSIKENKLKQLIEKEGFILTETNDLKDLKILLEKSFYDILIAYSITNDSVLTSTLNILKQFPKTFRIIFSKEAFESAITRKELFELDCNMLTSCQDSLSIVLKQIAVQIKIKGKLKCPICEIDNLNENTMWTHLPLYHINLDHTLEDTYTQCPSCSYKPKPNLQVHYRNSHGLVAQGLVHKEDNRPGQLYSFALVVVRRKIDNKYLIVQEFANVGFWLPGGRVDASEDLREAAIRETKEEAGVDIKLKGVLTLQVKAHDGYTRMRAIFYAEPVDDGQKAKSVPDYESVGACYIQPKELKKLKLRGDEPMKWINYVENGGTIYPLEIFTDE